MPVVTEVHLGNHTTRPIYIEVQPTTKQRSIHSPMYSYDNSTKSRSVVKQRRVSYLNEIPSKTNSCSTCQKVLLGLLIASIIIAIIIAITLAVVLTLKTENNTTTTTTTATTASISRPIISVYWSFDSTTTDLYGVYNGDLFNGATYNPISTNQPYIGVGRTLYLTSSLNQSFAVVSPFLNLSYTSFTIQAWIYSFSSSAGDISIFGQCQCLTCSNQCLFIIIRQNRLYTGFTFNDIVGSSVLSINTWYHITFVYNYETKQQILYLNGIQDSIKSNSETYQGLNGSIQIGVTNASLIPNYFNGYIDNVKVITRAKSSVEILNDASLIAYYSFDLPSPNLDNGVNGLNGTSINTATILGRINQAIRFTGLTSYFQAYGFYQLGYGVQTYKPFSISMWINPSSLSASSIVQQSIYQSGASCINMIGLYSASNGMTGQLIVHTYSWLAIFGPFIKANTWTHVSWTYSQSNGYTLCVNGLSYGSTGSTSHPITGNITWIHIGNNLTCSATYISNVPYQGSVDEMYIHNRELSQTDVTTLANP